MELTKKYLKTLFAYQDGKLFWKVDRCRARVGSEAGRTKSNGYCEVRVDGKLHGTHRLIFLMHKGYLPRFVDHIDGNPSNNKIENLREASHAENMRNSKKPVNNTSGFKGVTWHKGSKKWVAQCWFNNKKHYVGMFDNLLDAAIAVRDFRIKNHKDFARN
jgi:hypothetical protein